MKVRKESIWDRIHNRLPANDAATVQRVLGRPLDGPIDYMTIKALSELVDSYKGSARDAIRAYRRWCLTDGAYRLAATIRQREGEVLRRHAIEQASLYLDARRDYRDLFTLAMKPYQSGRRAGD